jgi:hypothetical protein
MYDNDKFQVLAMQADFAVCILANDTLTDLELLNVALPEPDEQTAREFDSRGLKFIGVAAIVKGQPRTALEVPLDPNLMARLSTAFIAHCEVLLGDKLEETAMGDSVAWLEMLYRLQDWR